MDLNKLLATFLYDNGYKTRFYNDGCVVTLEPNGYRVKIIALKQEIFLEEKLISNDHSILIRNYPQIKIERIKIGEIHEPNLFEKLRQALAQRATWDTQQYDEKNGEILRQ